MKKMMSKYVAMLMSLVLVVSSFQLNVNEVNAEQNEEKITFKEVVLGNNHSAAITENGDLYCWGNNEF